jgi:hypothetical protein
MVVEETLELRRVYRLESRNLRYGAWTGRAFVGLRNKFWRLRLDEEYSGADAGMYRTVRSAEPLDVVVPENISLRIILGSVDGETQRPVAFDAPIAKGGRGWYFTDTGEASEDIRPYAVGNPALFDFLRKLELSLGLDQLANAPAELADEPGPDNR